MSKNVSILVRHLGLYAINSRGYEKVVLFAILHGPTTISDTVGTDVHFKLTGIFISFPLTDIMHISRFIHLVR